ncbi:hypothetical protein FS842_008519 [Serendipita sp. 407]|nr:hypothetical protein FRC15_007552 [Serendipita sp. 397]KAG8767102.1 hypothetical protein FRC16_007477 [Serendipita sp. 398]KAG8828927.1 hypothetical protein FRC18_009714 [Serendipita sp. 400]KAG9057137.1 hypothetical protein FS842_008519 [Serendipita sp. 407]
MGLLDTIVKIVTQLLCGQEKTSKQDHTAGNAGYPGAAQPSTHSNQQQAHHAPPAHHVPAQQHQAPHKPPSPPYKPSSPPVGQHATSGGKPPRPLHQRIDENQANQHNPQYLDLRKRANQAGDAMGRCFEESKRAYENGDGARAKQLSEEGKQHKAEMEHLNKEASDWIYHANNTDSGPDEVDLHGLYVKEAISRTEQAIQAAQQRGDPSVRLIVGKGLHSQGHVAKLKPAIEELMIKYQLAAQLDPHNAGVLVVQLNGAQRGERGMGVDEIQHRLEKDDEQCIIM